MTSCTDFTLYISACLSLLPYELLQEVTTPMGEVLEEKKKQGGVNEAMIHYEIKTKILELD